ncbi:gluconokinase [Pseudarthrobacter sp. NamB4]|uniref:gluconokinase n=1 Tax=Pseudarthrobacter sp. NamB4 TaxID=2576837 RepID=UPI0010FEB9CE|nr:gluconokinase, GntK/IdnK-type [Pseudarthrobacter sp. NamB4]TLM71201.1 adenylyl-sulfate kinase [Pseudarthrobacter sp. NamB4]
MHSPLVVMGVSGSGKTTVGAALAARLGATFKDADGLHPLPNVEKMTAGVPLTDEDRWPWLRLVGAELSAPHEQGIVVACSALKRAYRDAIRAAAPSTTFILLNVNTLVLEKRLVQRPGHFMPAALLASQLETLEPLEADEAGMSLTSEDGVGETMERILAGLVPPR